MKGQKYELMQFAVGLTILTTGLFLFSQRFLMYSSLLGNHFYKIFEMNPGIIIIPLVIGLVWMFISKSSLSSKIFTGFAALLIIVLIMTSTNITLQTMTLYEWFIIMAFIFVGSGLIVKVLTTMAGNERVYKSETEETQKFELKYWEVEEEM